MDALGFTDPASDKGISHGGREEGVEPSTSMHPIGGPTDEEDALATTKWTVLSIPPPSAMTRDTEHQHLPPPGKRESGKPSKRPALDIAAAAGSRMRQAALAAATYKASSLVAAVPHAPAKPAVAAEMAAATAPEAANVEGDPDATQVDGLGGTAGTRTEGGTEETAGRAPGEDAASSMRIGAAEVVTASGDVYSGRRSRALSAEEAGMFMICPP